MKTFQPRRGWSSPINFNGKIFWRKKGGRKGMVVAKTLCTDIFFRTEKGLIPSRQVVETTQKSTSDLKIM